MSTKPPSKPSPARQRSLDNLKRTPPSPEERLRGGLESARKRERAFEALRAIERGEYVWVGAKTADGIACPLLEPNMRRLREEAGEPEPTRVVIDAPELEPQLAALQKLDEARRVRLLSDD